MLYITPSPPNANEARTDTEIEKVLFFALIIYQGTLKEIVPIVEASVVLGSPTRNLSQVNKRSPKHCKH